MATITTPVRTVPSSLTSGSNQPILDRREPWETKGHRGDAFAFRLWIAGFIFMEILQILDIVSGMLAR